MIDPIKLHSLVDGEMSPDEAKELREAIAADPQAGIELSAIHNIKDCVRDRALVYTCETTWSASVKRLGELDRARRVEGFVSRYAWGLSGAFILFIAVAGVMNRKVHGDQIGASDLTMISRLVPSVHSTQPTGPSGYDQWLDSLLHQAKVSLDPHAPHAIAILGYSVGDLDGHRVVRVSLRDAQGPLALWVIQGTVRAEDMDYSSYPGYVVGSINQSNCVIRCSGNQSVVLTANRSFDQLVEIVSHISAQ
jgi:hypothetical protein